ncbi:hypothetical protein Taro_023772 [Colocasia esculenta]|uniref:Heptahelical transmembrane protein 4 n=1 Tax=Colocasia esculenta TaxID=4460 RepID=A0A843V520_COLES|nr:hypothetical protein [Colocasia esculenta]
MDIGCAIAAGMMSSEVSSLGSVQKLEQSCCSVISAELRGQAAPKDHGGGRKRGKRCEHTKCELVDYHALPEFLKDNEFVLRYYRAEWPLKETLLSIFSIHNETVNVWTHLVGFFIFLVLALNTATVLPNTSDGTTTSVQVLGVSSGSDLYEDKVKVASYARSPQELRDELMSSSIEHLEIAERTLANCSPRNISRSRSFLHGSVLQSVSKEEVVNKVAAPPPTLEPITRWPFLAFLCGSMFCLLTSSVCHLISCHSQKMAYIMLRLDYVGISALIVTSFYPLVFYSFMCRPFLCNLYMGFITGFGAVTVTASLVPAFQTAEFRAVRAGIFFLMGFSGLVPILHKLVAFGHRPEVVLSAGYELLMGVFYGLGVVVYATRIPERWTPGQFDIVGHSHQLFHVLVIAGAYAHYLACLTYLQWRDVDRYC